MIAIDLSILCHFYITIKKIKIIFKHKKIRNKSLFSKMEGVIYWSGGERGLGRANILLGPSSTYHWQLWKHYIILGPSGPELGRT